ncbi:hypothetical protein ABPG74_000261 [Tetrahymena malaccensis]
MSQNKQKRKVDSSSEGEESEDDSTEQNQDNESTQQGGENEEETYEIDFKNLPSHACEYCGVHNKNSVVKCLNKDCNKWFCNGKQQGQGASHIIMHLVKSKHKEIQVHADNQNSDTTIECYICENKNIYLLGLVHLKNQEDQGLIICRQPCLNLKKYNEMQWEIEKWNPLIDEKMIVSWLAQPPSAKQMEKGFKVSQKQIYEYEEQIKTNPNFKLAQGAAQNQVKKLKPVLLRYKTGKQYFQTFYNLIEAEANYDKALKENLHYNSITVKWDISLKSRKVAQFVLPQGEDNEFNLLSGSELKITYKKNKKDEEWSAKGTITKVGNNDEVFVELSHNVKDTPPSGKGYTIEFVWKHTAVKRIKKGIKKFWQDEKCISSFLYFQILGHQNEEQQTPTLDIQLPKHYSLPKMPELNYYQVEAVKKALQQPLCLIQGPPGTGKTFTSTAIIYHLVKNIQKSGQRGQVLVCAPSNIVVDQLAERIHQAGIKVVRMCSRSREMISSSVEFLTLHNQVRSLDFDEYKEMQKLLELKEDQGELDHDDEDKYYSLKRQGEKEILRNAEVICSTCISSADPRLKDIRFKHVLIDEATQAIEPECLLPMLKGAKHVILVGDHRQLGPVVTCRDTAKAGLNKSLFERMVSMGIRPIRLQVQYRMHPDLSIFPSNTFYEGTLQNGVTFNDRQFHGDFPWPNKNKPLMFLNSCGVEEISSSGTSYLNRQETALIEDIVFRLIKAKVKSEQIGIITPYKGQRFYIGDYLSKNGRLNHVLYRQIEIASVDGFQGREKDYIIISCVRSNECQGIGFLTDPRRLNVAITRARYGLIIVGNAKVLARDNLWNNLLNHMKENKVLVDGTLNDLRQCTLKFRQPQKYVPERSEFQDNNNNDNDDARSTVSYKIDNINNFDLELPIGYGFRNSEFGFNKMPQTEQFRKIQKDQALNTVKNYGTQLFNNQNNQEIFFFGQDRDSNFYDNSSQQKNTGYPNQFRNNGGFLNPNQNQNDFNGRNKNDFNNQDEQAEDQEDDNYTNGGDEIYTEKQNDYNNPIIQKSQPKDNSQNNKTTSFGGIGTFSIGAQKYSQFDLDLPDEFK